MAQTTAKNGPGFPSELGANSSVGIKFTGKPPFFADVWRWPDLNKIFPGRYRANFLPLNRFLGECTIMALICGGFGGWMAAAAKSLWVFLPLMVVAICYAGMGLSMMRLDQNIVWSSEMANCGPGHRI